jgi:hypothetical protein
MKALRNITYKIPKICGNMLRVYQSTPHGRKLPCRIPTPASLHTYLYPSTLRQLPRHKRQPRRQPAIHRPRLPVDITRLIAPEEQDRPRNLVRNTPAPQRIQLPYLPRAPPRPRRVVRALRHPRLNQPRTHGITPHARPRELIRTRLHQTNHGRLASRVIRGPGVGAQPRHGGRRDDGALGVGLPRGRLEHGSARVLCGQEDGQRVHAQHVHEARCVLVPEHLCGADARVREEDVEPAVGGDCVCDDGGDRGLVCGVEDADVDFGGGVQGGEFALVRREVVRGEVADVYGFCGGAGELVGGGAADADGGVCAGDDDDFAVCASAGWLGSVVRFCYAPRSVVLWVWKVQFRRLRRGERRTREGTHLSPRSPAISRTLGIFSKVPGSAGGSESSLLSACCFTFGSEGMVGGGDVAWGVYGKAMLMSSR